MISGRKGQQQSSTTAISTSSSSSVEGDHDDQMLILRRPFAGQQLNYFRDIESVLGYIIAFETNRDGWDWSSSGGATNIPDRSGEEETTHIADDSVEQHVEALEEHYAPISPVAKLITALNKRALRIYNKLAYCLFGSLPSTRRRPNRSTTSTAADTTTSVQNTSSSRSDTSTNTRTNDSHSTSSMVVGSTSSIDNGNNENGSVVPLSSVVDANTTSSNNGAASSSSASEHQHNNTTEAQPRQLNRKRALSTNESQRSSKSLLDDYDSDNLSELGHQYINMAEEMKFNLNDITEIGLDEKPIHDLITGECNISIFSFAFQYVIDDNHVV